MSVKIDKTICRVCLKSGATISLRKNKSLREKFHQTTRISVNMKDKMPPSLCDRCEARLNISYNFRQQSIVADRHLKTFVQKINQQFKRVFSVTNDTSDLTKANEIELQILLEAGYNPAESDGNHLDEKIDCESTYEEIFEGDGRQSIRKSDRISNQTTFKMEEFSDGDLEDGQHHEHFEIENLNNDSDTDEFGENFNDVGSQFSEPKQGNEENTVSKKLPTKRKRATQTPREIVKYVCSRCNKVFSNKQNLQRHSYTHDNIKRFDCKICGKKFAQATSLRLHLLIHTNEKPHACPMCQKNFRQPTLLKLHIFRRHKDTDIVSKAFPCTDCNKICYSEFELECHGRRHKKDNLFRCKYCNEIFTSRNEMRTHENNSCILIQAVQKFNDDEVTDFECNICPGVFETEELFEEHMRSHQEEN